ncbi:outer membrane transport energization protein TonB [Winogradskyella pacifica]|uniref:Outer membrane transport energization protein TonB n=1 Tax=Winogradskyella pacifica TaxID=664642 RepID=A0A3D9LPM2_9FLAO|nr:energy transducer TonB [Winogradskyella pacifica]REE07933.1 outer membrane transport energization protein TonB [Winogradskyella pacifica]
MELKKNPKANVGRNSSLFFAVGLNVMLLLTYLGLEHKTYDIEAVKIDVLMLEDQFDEDIPITIIDVLPPPPPPQQQVVTEVITIVEDVADVEESVIQSTEIGQDDTIDEREVGIEDVAVEDVEEDIEVPFALIEKVPQFPGCTGNNKELRACFERKIQEHLHKHFKYPEAAAELNIDGKVYVFFLIDKYGNVTKVKSRGPDQLLETEAERIINLLPKMEPGRQRDMNVSVPYSIPINFKLQQQ